MEGQELFYVVLVLTTLVALVLIGLAISRDLREAKFGLEPIPFAFLTDDQTSTVELHRISDSSVRVIGPDAIDQAEEILREMIDDG